MKFIPQSFNDFLALFLIAIITVLWILQGQETVSLDPQVTGALIVTWTLLIQYYYRKRSGGD